jgi:uncharacterized protein YndB with AHSA1/START domain
MSATRPAGTTLAVTRMFDAPPERVFDAWTDSGTAGRFLFRTEGGELKRCEVDGRIDGRFRIDELRPDGLAEHRGEFVELDRPRRLAFDFAAGGEEASTRVTVEIEPVESGSKLTLSHGLDPRWAQQEERIRRGWTLILESLARVLES